MTRMIRVIRVIRGQISEGMMQSTIREAKTLRELPFAVGVIQGHGAWADRQGGQGTYQAKLTILAEAGGVITHIVTRVFLNGDGAALYEENSRVEFTPSSDAFFEVAIRFEGKEHRGNGYCFGNRCHYEVTLAGGARLEATYTLNGESIQLLGSSIKNDNLTVWAETLAPSVQGLARQG